MDNPQPSSYLIKDLLSSSVAKDEHHIQANVSKPEVLYR